MVGRARKQRTVIPGVHATIRLLEPAPRDCVTLPCCGRGSVTQSFSCRSAGGGNDTGSSTSHKGHRSVNGVFNDQASGSVGAIPSGVVSATMSDVHSCRWAAKIVDGNYPRAVGNIHEKLIIGR